MTHLLQGQPSTSADKFSSRATKANPIILGISTTHETGCAILDGVEILAAISEERLDRVKFSTSYPPKRSIDECFRVSGVKPEDITDVVISGLPAHRLLPRLIKGQFQDIFDFHGFVDYFPHFCKVLYRSFYFYRALGYGGVKRYLREKYGISPKVHFVEHHLCHVAAAYRTAPFDNALIVTADGVGDDISLTVSSGRDGTIERLGAVPYPHSFGQFYTACTQVLGFRGGRHEGKITGLSGYGKPEPELFKKIKATIRKSGKNFKLDKRFYSEGIIRGFSKKKLGEGESLFDALQYRNYKKALEKLVEGEAREDVAAVFQTLLEEEMLEVVRPYKEESGLENLVLCGGVFANVKLNSYLFRELGFKNIYIFPHMGDGGLSVGAALELQQAKPEPFENVYFGPEFSDAEIEEELKAKHGEGIRFERPENLSHAVAERLAEKNVVARFSGRMEYGPRALGNRSILYSASDPGSNTWLNNRLRRTEFMPFAPIAQEEHADEFFLDRAGTEHACKFMTLILDCTEKTKESCPAVVHVDGTARPQLVNREINPGMHDILERYKELTGIPLLVNTSFNMHEEPIVCTPSDAVRAFLDSRLDFLAVGPFLAWIDGNAKSSESTDASPE